MREQQAVDLAGGQVALSSTPGMRVEVDARAERRGSFTVVATVRISTGEDAGTLRLVPTGSASERLTMVVEFEGDYRLLPFDAGTSSWTTEVAPGQELVLHVVEHPRGTAPDAVLAALRESRAPREGITRGIPPPPLPPPSMALPPLERSYGAPSQPPVEAEMADMADMAEPEMADMADMAEPELAEMAEGPGTGADTGAEIGVGRGAAEPARLVFAEVGASMPAVVVLDDPVDVVVRLSRGEVRVEGGRAHDEQVIIVDPAQPITITLLRRGLALAGPPGAPESGQRELHLPAPGEPDAELTFGLRAIAVGEAEVQVVVRQDTPQPLATLRLTATVLPAGASPPEALHPARVEAASAVAAGVSPFLAPRTLTIDENLEGATSTLTFDLVLPGVRERFERIIDDKPAVLAEVFQGLDEAWRVHREIPNLRERSAAFQAELRAIGARLGARTLPRDLRTWLREHPQEIDELTILTSGETDIPWELVHTWEEIDGEDPEGLGFLGRAGLVRWVYNTPHPRDLSIRPGAAYHLVPEYADAGLALPNSTLELAALAPFGAQAVTPSDGAALSRLLSSGEVDLLHFAGHGRCDDNSDPPVREMLLADFVPSDGSGVAVAPADRSRVCWSLDDLREALPDRPPLALHDPGPLIVINACRLGHPPSRRSEAGGFAESFLRAGAGAFVGCLWSIGDEPARAFVEEFYARLDAGDTMARATVDARQAARRSGDLSWLAYTVYAHPDARLVDRVPAPTP